MRPGAIMTLSREDDPNAHAFWYAQVRARAFLIPVVHAALDVHNRFCGFVGWVCSRTTRQIILLVQGDALADGF